jgi:AcrR family transcriptional regulator
MSAADQRLTSRRKEAAVTSGASTPRARYREQTRAEIKELALRQLAEGGQAAVALTRIAKDLGLSGPALYRYFTSRDDLLSALIRDAYDDVAAVVTKAADAAAERTPRSRLHALAGAYRLWAVRQPHRYLLIQGTPVPGYTAPADTVERARAALGPFLPVFVTASPTPAVLTVVAEMDTWARRDDAVADWVTAHAGERAAGAPGVPLAGAVLAWSQLHGAVGLETAGQFQGMGHDGATLLAAQIDSLADSFGLA